MKTLRCIFSFFLKCIKNVFQKINIKKNKDFQEKQRKIRIFSKNAPAREFLRNTTL